MDDFEELYKLWPTKGDKANTKLAYDFVLNKFNNSPRDYIKAAELWLFKASPFQKDRQTLANWLRDEKFEPELREIKQSGGLAQAIEHAQIFKDLAMVVMGEWNRLRRGWWAKIEDFDGRSYCVTVALRDEFFQKNWQRALSAAVNIFQYASRDSIGRIELTPSIEWFCDLNERNAAKLLEGHFGKAHKPTVIERLERPVFDPSDKADLRELFSLTKANIKEKAELKKQTDGPWKVRRRIDVLQLTYKGVVILEEPMPYKEEDIIAAQNTLLAQANLHNKNGYEPTLAKEVKKQEPPKDNPFFS